MDFQLIAIFVIFILLFILEQIEKKQEDFVVKNQGYTNPSVLLEPGFIPLPYSVNYNKENTNFKNFGTFGSYPPNPLCFSCQQKTDDITPPYLHANDLGDLSGDNYSKIATSCRNLYGKNYANLNRSLLVAARSTGRPRVCRKLL